ncbi:MAG: alpha/beta fold hydrolase [Acetobacteraceae bacterium]|nr:alpha/beta fold hydrolase [Acetobacteraceae bacterium]
MSEHEAQILQPAHQRTQMEVEQVRERAGVTYLESGDPAATPILFLHGIGGAARAFAGQLAHFGARYRALAWNMPGYEGSAPLPLVTMEALAASLGAFIAALSLERPVLVGHSIGGMIVQRLLAEAPHAARAVVLAQTSAAFGSRDPAWAEAFISARLGPLDAGRSMADLAPEIIRQSTGDGADPAGLALAQDCMAHVPDSTYRDMILAMPGFDQRDALARIAAPTLLLAGSKDQSAPAAGMERMAAKIRTARYAVIEGAGHLAYVEQPARFNAALDAFLDEALR